MSLLGMIKNYLEDRKLVKQEKEERERQQTIEILQKMLDDKRKELEAQGKL